MAPWVDELVPFPGAPGIPERPPDGTLPQWLDEMAARRWDLALQVYGDNPAANAVTAGDRRSAGRRLRARRHVRARPGAAPALPAALHEVDRHLALLEHLGLPPVRPGRSSGRSRRPTRTGRHSSGLRPGRTPSCTRGRTSPSRLWPAERFAEVADGCRTGPGGRGRRRAVGGATPASVVAAGRRAGPRRHRPHVARAAYAPCCATRRVVVANDTARATCPRGRRTRRDAVSCPATPRRGGTRRPAGRRARGRRLQPRARTSSARSTTAAPCGSARSGCWRRRCGWQERRPRLAGHPRAVRRSRRRDPVPAAPVAVGGVVEQPAQRRGELDPRPPAGRARRRPRAPPARRRRRSTPPAGPPTPPRRARAAAPRPATGSAKTSACANSRRGSAAKPVKRTGRPAACCSSAARSRPSPPRSTASRTPSATSSRTASSSTSKPFCAVSRPSAATTGTGPAGRSHRLDRVDAVEHVRQPLDLQDVAGEGGELPRHGHDVPQPGVRRPDADEVRRRHVPRACAGSPRSAPQQRPPRGPRPCSSGRPG
jgi:hypothetical protein